MVSLLFSAVFQVILFALVPFIVWLIAGRKSKENFVKWLGLKKPETKSVVRMIVSSIIFAGIYTVIMTVILNTALSGVESATSQFAGEGLSAIPSILIYAIIQTSLSEEILFRGFIGKRFINKFGFKVGNTIQAVAFGLMHGVPFFMATGNVLVLVLVTVLPTVLGFFMGYMNEKMAKGSIVPSWILHATLNILSGIIACL